ncbi:unnamed protein product [Prunus armeniaca]
MVSKSQSKDSQASKGQGKDIAISKAQSLPSNPPKKMRFTSSSEKDPSDNNPVIPSRRARRYEFVDTRHSQFRVVTKEERSRNVKDLKGQVSLLCPALARCRTLTGFGSDSKVEFGLGPVTSSATFDEVTKSTCGINTMSKAAIEMQSYIGVLACTRVSLVDNKWTQLPKDLKEQIWETVQMAYVVGEVGKKMFILPFANEKEKLKECPQLYNFIEKSEWDAFVASRLCPDFEAVHSEQSQRREKCEYNHRLSRKGYVGLEDQLEETILGEEIDRSLLWKKAREDKQGNISNPKVAEKAKLIVSFIDSVLNL